tara:strand:- start:161 stop:1075 length:915 start_codon:yes stop_codon:yes gene_type:complete
MTSFVTGYVMGHDLMDLDTGTLNDTAPASGRTIMLVHGMWSRPHVWQNFRHYFEARGYRVITPVLRHHDIEPGETPDPALATTSLLDYAADLEREIRLLGEKPILIGHSMGGTLAQMLTARGLSSGSILLASAHCAPVFAVSFSVMKYIARVLGRKSFWRHTQIPSYAVIREIGLNGMSERDAHNHYATLVPESGRVVFELAFWFLDRTRAALVDARAISAPLLFLTGTNDRLTPLASAQRTAAYYGAKAKLEALQGHAHWLPTEPGWENIAARALSFIENELQAAEVKTGATTVAPALDPQLV